MLILNIGGQRYKYRSKQSEITLRIGKEIEETLKQYSCDCNPEFQKWALAILCGCDYNVADQVAEEQLALLIGVHPFFANQIKVRHQTFFKLKYRLYKYSDFEHMSVERYGNLDFLATEERYDELYLSLYEKVKWYHIKYWLPWLFAKNHKTIDDCNYFKYRLALHFYFEYKRKLLEDYRLSAENPQIPKDQQPDEYKLTTLEKYGMYHILMQICDSDYDKLERWLSRDITELLKYLRYSNLKNIAENQKTSV